MIDPRQPPECTLCDQIILGEYVIIKWLRLCPKCFVSRRVIKVPCGIVGEYLADQSLTRTLDHIDLRMLNPIVKGRRLRPVIKDGTGKKPERKA